MAINNSQIVYSSDYKKQGNSTFKFKDFTFVYGPRTISVRGDSRLAEYKYLNRNGVEYTKLGDKLSITLSGVWIKEVSGRTFSESAQGQAAKLKNLHKDNTPGQLVLQGFGSYTCILQDYELVSSGDYPGEFEFTVSFLEHTPVPIFYKTVPSFEQKQEELSNIEQRNVEYSIKSGDTLSSIAAKYGVTLSMLKSWNPNLFDASHRSGNLVFPGETVIVKKSTTGTETPNSGETQDSYWEGSSATDISRDKRFSTFLENKGKTANENPVAVPEVNGSVPVYGPVNSYMGLSAGDSIKVSSVTQQGKAIGNFFRELPTTLQKLEEEARKQNLEGRVSTTVQSEPFPIFTGIVEYPKSRKTEFSSIAPVKIPNQTIIYTTIPQL